MKKLMKYFRPLSSSMIQKLKQCRKAELDTSNKKVFTMEDMSYAVGPLFKRGLIEMKKEAVDNKVLECIHLTKDGIEYLEKLNHVEKNSKV
jgi:hypothetical protein